MTAPHAGGVVAHTDEQRWLAWPGWSRLAPLELPAPGTRVVVVAAHPDDEVLGVGGLIAQSGLRHVDFVSVTDGEASHPGSPMLTADRLRKLRPAELEQALRELGHQTPAITRLGLPDSGLPGAAGAVAVALAPLLVGAELVIGPWRHDGHPDHDTVGAVLAQLCGSMTPLWEFPVWTWRWAAPGDPRVPWDRARVLWLSDRTRQCKAAAVGRFATQITGDDGPVLPPDVLANFARTFEVVFT